MNLGSKENATARQAAVLRSSNERWAVFGVCMFLVAAIWIVFGQTTRFEFINFDDNQYVYENPEVSGGLTSKGIVWGFTHVHASNWHPLTWVSHMLDCQLYGLSPGGHHLTNVLLHTAVAILLFLILRRMTGFLWRSAFVAAVFAIHPLRVESVAWVSERKDVLSGLFFMLTIGAYVRYACRAWSPSRYGLVVLLYALGLMCKPMLVTLPFVLALLDYWPLNRWQESAGTEPAFKFMTWAVPKRLFFEKLPLLGLAVASCAVTIFAQEESIHPYKHTPLALCMSNALVSSVDYLGQMFWPARLALLYPFPSGGVAVSSVVFSAVLLTVIFTGVFLLRRHRPYLLTGWLWYLIMLGPVIGILQVGQQARADRYTYLPQIGIYLLLTWAVADLCAARRIPRPALASLSAVILVTLIFCARTQASHWRDSESLWRTTIAHTTGNNIAHNNLGRVLAGKGQIHDAIMQYEQALEIKFDYSDARNNLGIAFYKSGRLDEAAAAWKKALDIEPDDMETRINLGGVLLATGHPDEAIVHYMKALEINPQYAPTHANLGIALMKKERVDEAIAHCKQALEINPGSAEAHATLGDAYLKKGQMQEAMSHYQKAVEIRPDIAQAQHNLAGLLYLNGRVDEAIVHDQKAVELNPGYAQAHNNLGIALLQKGRVEEAIVHYRKAVEIQPGYAEAHYHLGMALIQKGGIGEAMGEWEKAMEIEPSNTSAQNELAWVLATWPDGAVRNGARALELALRADQLSGGKDPNILDTLAAAYAEVGRFSEAVDVAERAAQIAVSEGNADLTNALQARIKLYRTNSPFRDTSLSQAPNPVVK